MTLRLDYFFSIGSPWAYIGLDSFVALAGKFGAEVVPYVIPLIEENGGIYSRNRPEARRAYWLVDLQRWAALRGKPLQLAGRDGLGDPSPAALWVIAAALDGQDWLKLTAALQEAFWARAENIGGAGVAERIAAAAGFDTVALSARIASGEAETRRLADIETARTAGVFGVPTWRHGTDLFWGQDSLPFLERQLAGETLIP